MDFCDGCETYRLLTDMGMCDTCSKCECSAGGKMCYRCSSEYDDPCRSCNRKRRGGVSPCGHCWVCYDHLYGTPKIQELKKIIEEIEARLRRGGMTKGQKDDWIWILQNRRDDLAHERKVAMQEMWNQYDADDLRKMDRQFI